MNARENHMRLRTHWMLRFMLCFGVIVLLSGITTAFGGEWRKVQSKFRANPVVVALQRVADYDIPCKIK